MSEETKPAEGDKPILDLDGKEPVKEPAKEPSKEPTEGTNELAQEDLDWRSKLSENLKNSKTLQKFKKVEDLASAYENLEKKLPSADLLALNEKHTADTVSKLLKQVVPKTDYPENMDSSLRASLEKTNIPAVLADSIQKVYNDEHAKALETQRNLKISEYKEGLKKLNLEGDLERALKVGLEGLGMSQAEYTDIFKDEKLNPKLVGKIAEFGRSRMSDSEIQIGKGGNLGLPSDPVQLKSMLNNLNRLKIQTVDPIQIADINKQIEPLRNKLTKVMGTQNQQSGILG